MDYLTLFLAALPILTVLVLMLGLRWRSTYAVQSHPECMTCWARYLCGGGCRLNKTPKYCDYMRLWCTEAIYIASRLSTEEARRVAP